MAESFSCHVSLTLSPAFFFASILKDSRDYIVPGITFPSQDQLISSLNCTCNLNSLLPCNMTYTQVLRVMTCTSLGGWCSPDQSQGRAGPWASLTSVPSELTRARLGLEEGRTELVLLEIRKKKVQLHQLHGLSRQGVVYAADVTCVFQELPLRDRV